MTYNNDNFIDWDAIDEAGGGSKMLPAGGYVATITACEWVGGKEYMRFTYDIAEGQYAGFFANDDRGYTHQFTRSFKDRALPFTKKFLRFVNESNPGFDAFVRRTPDELARELVGRRVGIIVQREDYTNPDGDDRARMNVEEYASADDIRNGRYKLPEPKDNRERKPEATHAAGGSVYDADLPF